MPEQIMQLVYSSTAQQKLSPEEIREVLTIARQHNSKRGITGMLVYHDGTFIQVLEGEPYAVLSLFHRIEKDSRHSSVSLLLKRMHDSRAFAEWQMGYLPLEKGEEPEGFVSYVQELPSLIANNDTEDRTLELLSQFMEGRWRKKLT